MKVALFCGGLGTRLRENEQSHPKPMVNIGYRPILWHVMKYYAHFGHKDFVLCLGYKADEIKRYFLEYDECVSNDFVMSNGGKTLDILSTDIDDWRITFADTGLRSSIGQRLKRVEHHLRGEEYFLANYSDGLTDLPLNEMFAEFRRRDKVACFVSVPASQSFHVVKADQDGAVTSIRHVTDSDLRINGGFFILRQDIFDYLKDGEDLVYEPFQRLIADDKLFAYRHDGFWACMDTFKEKQLLEDLHQSGTAPWTVWEKPSVNTL